MKSTQNIFLIGLMGAGKSTIGRVLSTILHKDFYDSDHEIESRTGVRIATIFDIEGEKGFRLREEAMIRSLVERRNIVLATGGGAVLNKNTQQLLKANGLVIYLYADMVDLWARVCQDKKRPLLETDDPKASLESLFTVRHPIYQAAADMVIHTGRQHAHAIARTLSKALGHDAAY